MRTAPIVKILVAAASALACASCANFKFWDRGDSLADDPVPAVVAAPMPSDEKAKQDQGEAKPSPPRIVDDGLRLPDMLSLPSERELRRPASETATDGTAGVTARPPAEPPQQTRSSSE